MLIDTHAHLNFNAYRDDSDKVLRRTLAGDVWVINVGSQYSTSKKALQLAQKYSEGVFASVALHPIHIKSKKTKNEIDQQEITEDEINQQEFDYNKYKELAVNEKVVAIGETGLDYYHLGGEQKEQEEIKALQKKIFLGHLRLANELNKPVIFHCREAHQEIIEILKSQVSDFKLRGVIHSFSGRWSQADQYLAMGFYLGFNGIITYTGDYDKVIKNMPLERVLIETDCPYLAPVPFRGQRNEPLYVKYVAQKIAQIKEVSFEKVAEITTKNARELFGI